MNVQMRLASITRIADGPQLFADDNLSTYADRQAAGPEMAQQDVDVAAA